MPFLSLYSFISEIFHIFVDDESCRGKEGNAAIVFYESISDAEKERITAVVSEFNARRKEYNGFYAVSIATPYRRYYALWRIFADGKPPLFIRTLTDRFVTSVDKAMEVIRHCRVVLKWMDNNYFVDRKSVV